LKEEKLYESWRNLQSFKWHDELLLSADGYEETGSLYEVVIYTQLKDGEVMPAGTRYTRSVANFSKNFVLKSNELEK